MADQLYDNGDVLRHNGVDLENVAVSYQEDSDGNKHTFSYTFRPKEELDAEREAEAQRLRDEEEAKAQAEAEPEEAPSQPEEAATLDDNLPVQRGWPNDTDLTQLNQPNQQETPNDYAS